MPSRHFLQKFIFSRFPQFIFSRSPSVFLLRKNPPPSQREARCNRHFVQNQTFRTNTIGDGAFDIPPILHKTKNSRTNQKSPPLEGKALFAEQNSDEVENQIIQITGKFHNGGLVVYTSPPLTAQQNLAHTHTFPIILQLFPSKYSTLT